jgi:hypothetical protein
MRGSKVMILLKPSWAVVHIGCTTTNEIEWQRFRIGLPGRYDSAADPRLNLSQVGHLSLRRRSNACLGKKGRRI